MIITANTFYLSRLAETIHNLLEISLAPSVPASLRIIPTKYNMIVRLWTYSFHKLLESLRRASFTSPLALEHLQDFIYYAYTFYTGLLEEPSLNSFKSGWLEALGDLARYLMAVAAMVNGGVGGRGGLTTKADRAAPQLCLILAWLAPRGPRAPARPESCPNTRQRWSQAVEGARTGVTDRARKAPPSVRGLSSQARRQVGCVLHHTIAGCVQCGTQGAVPQSVCRAAPDASQLPARSPSRLSTRVYRMNTENYRPTHLCAVHHTLLTCSLQSAALLRTGQPRSRPQHPNHSSSPAGHLPLL